jgi:DNA-binding NarL/FixJ family response regulator
VDIQRPSRQWDTSSFSKEQNKDYLSQVTVLFRHPRGFSYCVRLAFSDLKSFEEKAMTRVRILLADDHTLFCNVLRELLEPEYEVVGNVGDGHELLRTAATLQPDVVVVDIGMPALNGLEAGRRLKKANPRLKLIYLTMNNDVELAQEALQAGASAFVLKNAQSSQLLKAIRDSLRGVSYIAPEIRKAMMEIFIRDPKAVKRSPHLTDRQREVLQMLAEGRRLGEIASQLGISYRTVRFHKVRLMEELGISNNTGIVKYAMKHGIVSPA